MTLDEIQKLCNEATPGPWQYLYIPMERDPHVIWAAGRCIARVYGDNEDTRLIASSRMLIPLLLNVALVAQHAVELGYLGDGSTSSMMEVALKALEDMKL